MLALALAVAAFAAPEDAAVVVGVSDYYALPQVTGAAKNAADWHRWLTTSRGLKPQRVHLLRDADATREEIEAATRVATASVGPGGTLFFVFIGHGAPDLETGDGLLLGVDTQPKEISVKARGLPRDTVLSMLSQGKQAHTLVVLDACFSGQTPDGTAPLVPAMMATVPVKKAVVADTITVLSSSATASGPLPGRARPAFSALILGGMRGWGDANHDKKVDVDEAFAFARATLIELVRDRDQRPSRVGPSFLLAKNATEPMPNFAGVIAARDGLVAEGRMSEQERVSAPEVVSPQRRAADEVLFTFAGYTPLPEGAHVTAVVTPTSLRLGVAGRAPREIQLGALAEVQAVGSFPLLTPPIQIILRDGTAIHVDVDSGQRNAIVQKLNAAIAQAR
jgi:hypothetical protein